jgi:hypothetical protein
MLGTAGERWVNSTVLAMDRYQFSVETSPDIWLSRYALNEDQGSIRAFNSHRLDVPEK